MVDKVKEVIKAHLDAMAQKDACFAEKYANSDKDIDECMDYYKKPYSLILSARSVTDGARIETVEVSLRSFKVVQSHGLQNSYTPYHDEIIKLVEKNMDIIKKAV